MKSLVEFWKEYSLPILMFVIMGIGVAKSRKKRNEIKNPFFLYLATIVIIAMFIVITAVTLSYFK